MKLLIHACCADCLLHLFESFDKLRTIGDGIGVYYYNPNIHPQSEYFEAVGKNTKKELRCPKCWQLRLNSAFLYAKENGYMAVTTTMLSSSYLDRELITRMGQKMAEKYKLKFLVPIKSKCDLKTRGFYKQNYCGCIFSLNERFGEKYNIHL